jgi:ABC-2 type transport system permease protein
MNSSIYQLVLLQFRSFFREPAIIFWAIIFPILMAWVLGIAFTTKGEVNKTVMVIEPDKHATARMSIIFNMASEELYGEDIQNPTRIKFIVTDSEEKAFTAMKKGEINLFLKIVNDTLTYNYDTQNPEAVNTFLIIERELAKKELTKINSAELRTKTVPVTAKGNRYIDFLIPGLIAMGIMNSCLWGISWNLIEFRMKKLLRRMVATPMKKSDFLFSLLITRIIICAVETSLLLIFAFLYFKISLEGSVAGLILVYLSGIIAFSGISILISSRVSKSEVGNGLINAVSLPMVILSGIFFSYHNFPDWSVNIIKYLPLTLLADTIRGIFNEGSGLTQVMFPCVLLTSLGVLTFFAGLKLYKWY